MIAGHIPMNSPMNPATRLTNPRSNHSQEQANYAHESGLTVGLSGAAARSLDQL